MRNAIKWAAVTLCCLGAARAGAIVVSPTTNVVQNINIKLTVYSEGDTTTNGSVVNTPVVKSTKTSKDIVKLLGDAMGTSFSTAAKLILVSPATGDGQSSIFVQDGTNKVDVSGFFSYDQSGTDVQAKQINTVSGVEKGTDYNIIEFSMHDNGGQTIGAHFDVGGLSIVKSASIVKSGAVLGKAHQISANLAGTGDFTDNVGSHPMVLQVSLVITGTTVVVTP